MHRSEVSVPLPFRSLYFDNQIITSLAMAMMYIGLATFFRRHDWVLHDTNYERDVKVERDCFNGEASAQSKGIRVKHVNWCLSGLYYVA